jgi:hypothetical protein
MSGVILAFDPAANGIEDLAAVRLEHHEMAVAVNTLVFSGWLSGQRVREGQGARGRSREIAASDGCKWYVVRIVRRARISETILSLSESR